MVYPVSDHSYRSIGFPIVDPTRRDERHDPRQDAGRHDLPLGSDRYRIDDREERGDQGPLQKVGVTLTIVADRHIVYRLVLLR